jgi:DNA ligase D-like protein (predicted ligase)
MLATLTHDFFDDADWIYERKLDGVRTVVTVKDGEVKLTSRNDNEQTKNFPELAEALSNQIDVDLIADGEIIAFDGNKSSFSRLQDRLGIDQSNNDKDPDVKVYLYLFDVMYTDGYDLQDLPLHERKKVLRELELSDPIRRTSYRRENGIAYHKEACEKGWEGIIAKDGNSKYANSRSKKWLKFKCTADQELVIGGYTMPEGDRKGFGALLVGFYKDGKLQYAGKVGTGYDDDFLKSFKVQLDKVQRKTSPFADFDEEHDVQFVTPKYIGAFSFTEWTDNNKLRHPSFKGLRHDKNPEDVVKE